MNDTALTSTGAPASSANGGGAAVSLIGGIDIGGTKLAVGIADQNGALLADRRQPTLVERGPDAVVDDLIEMVKGACVDAGFSAADLAFLGVASPGPLSQKRGVILSTPNMPGWENYPLIARLHKVFGCPTVLENDANAACLGEALFGAGEGKPFVSYFTISTGIGGGFVQNGKVLRGADGNAAEYGHQIIVPFDGALCGCGQRGHLEAYANGANIVRRTRERIAAGAKSMLPEMAGSVDKITTRYIVQAANQGDALAKSIWEETGEYIAIGVVNVIHNFNPNIVVLGGGVMNAGDLLLDPIRRHVESRVMSDYLGSFTIERATLGDRVGIMGAVGLALEHGILNRAA